MTNLRRKKGPMSIVYSLFIRPFVNLASEILSPVKTIASGAYGLFFDRHLEYPHARPVLETDDIEKVKYIIVGEGDKQEKYVITDNPEDRAVTKTIPSAISQLSWSGFFQSLLPTGFAVSCGLTTCGVIVSILAGAPAYIAFGLGAIIFYSTTKANYMLTKDDVPSLLSDLRHPKARIFHYTQQDVDAFKSQYLNLRATHHLYTKTLRHYLQFNKVALTGLRYDLINDLKQLRTLRFACKRGSKEWVVVDAEIRAKTKLVAITYMSNDYAKKELTKLSEAVAFDIALELRKLKHLKNKIKTKQLKVDAYAYKYNFKSADDIQGECDELIRKQAKHKLGSGEYEVLALQIEAKNEVLGYIHNDPNNDIDRLSKGVSRKKTAFISLGIISGILAGITCGAITYYASIGAMATFGLAAAATPVAWAAFIIGALVLGVFLFKGFADTIRRFDKEDWNIFKDKYLSWKGFKIHILRKPGKVLVSIIAVSLAAFGLFSLFIGAMGDFTKLLREKGIAGKALAGVISAVMVLVGIVVELFFVIRTWALTLAGWFSNEGSFSQSCSNMWGNLSNYFNNLDGVGKGVFIFSVVTFLWVVPVALNILTNLLKLIKDPYFMNAAGNGGPSAQGQLDKPLVNSMIAKITMVFVAGFASFFNSLAGMFEPRAQSVESVGWRAEGKVILDSEEKVELHEKHAAAGVEMPARFPYACGDEDTTAEEELGSLLPLEPHSSPERSYSKMHKSFARTQERPLINVNKAVKSLHHGIVFQDEGSYREKAHYGLFCGSQAEHIRGKYAEHMPRVKPGKVRVA